MSVSEKLTFAPTSNSCGILSSIFLLTFSISSENPTPIPCAMNTPTSSRNLLDGLSIPKALFAASNRLFARLETLFFNQFQPLLMPFQIPCTMLLPIVAKELPILEKAFIIPFTQFRIPSTALFFTSVPHWATLEIAPDMLL